MEAGNGSSPSDDYSSDNASSAALPHASKTCSICHASTPLKVFNCVHTLGKRFLAKEFTRGEICCPQYTSDIPVAPGSVAAFSSNKAASNVVGGATLKGTSLRCTACVKEFIAIARCFDCADLLCISCAMAHHFMRTFEGHRVLSLRELQTARDGLSTLQDVACPRHHSATLRFFCHSCDWPVCEECALLEHPRAMHKLQVLLPESAALRQAGKLPNLLDGVVIGSETRRSEPPQSDLCLSPIVFCGSNNPRPRTSSTEQLGSLLTSFAHISPHEKLSSGDGKFIWSSSSLGAIQVTPASPPLSTQARNPSQYQACIPLRHYFLKPDVERKKMAYYFRFGGFGFMRGQFAEPSGVAMTTQDNIIVADSNNHRIQIFDQHFRFKRQFGKSVRRGGQMSCPNRVAVVRHSNLIVVTERPPSHQIQVFNQNGQFVRKFGGTILMNPRGVAVDEKGRVVVVESKIFRVVIFDLSGNVLRSLDLSNHLKFPNGVAVNDQEEVFISDNRAHCVKVFSYGGAFLRQIGGRGLTDFPVAVRINNRGHVVVADNNYYFHLTVFTQDGSLVHGLESISTHDDCFDIGLMDNGSVVLACKDHRLYAYSYTQVPAPSPLKVDT
ncbi:protein brain tumor-like [Haemaphysalis longicornis]